MSLVNFFIQSVFVDEKEKSKKCTILITLLLSDIGLTTLNSYDVS